ncbi:uncharacterized protein LOC123704897 isoform X1 [Colias croceus]|uniref:uncharacterized protein LOC123704897 isoform X1 n=2 Tax=Colias crocea TaxID=72248 RepID=UPI001E27CFAB|nr:uncharacterized protein LOC123704897 isoform X1 [Colias croceus]
MERNGEHYPCYLFGCYTAYGIINMEYCNEAFPNENRTNNVKKLNGSIMDRLENNCVTHDCNNTENKEVCGIRQDGPGYRIRLFRNKCELYEVNCKERTDFFLTDLFICKSALNYSETTHVQELNYINRNIKDQINGIRNLVIINGAMLGKNTDINDTIDNFFAATHVFDLPMKEMNPLNTRRRLIKNAGPIKIFVPLIDIPKEKKNDTYHQPTLSSCYHKCPTKFPDTYAPVCGVPGIVAREPALMFKNHCFMDVAQCKMFWENKSSTSHSSSYIESSFLFCMGDEMNALYRFLPAIRTLQRMGRLKKKGKFRAKLKNFRFINEFRSGRPNFMG